MSFQIYLLIDNYLEFKTDVSVDMILKNNAFDLKIDDDFPAITICSESRLNEIAFNENLENSLIFEKVIEDFDNRVKYYFDNDTFFQKLIKFNLKYYTNYTLEHSYHYSPNFLINLFDVRNEKDLESYSMEMNNKSWFGFKRNYEELEYFDSFFHSFRNRTDPNNHNCNNFIH